MKEKVSSRARSFISEASTGYRPRAGLTMSYFSAIERTSLLVSGFIPLATISFSPASRARAMTPSRSSLKKALSRWQCASNNSIRRLEYQKIKRFIPDHSETILNLWVSAEGLRSTREYFLIPRFSACALAAASVLKVLGLEVLPLGLFGSLRLILVWTFTMMFQLFCVCLYVFWRSRPFEMVEQEQPSC